MFDLSIAFLNAPLNCRGTRGTAALSGIAALLAGCGGGGGGLPPANNAPAANRDPVVGAVPIQDTTVNATVGEDIDAVDLTTAFSDPDGGALIFTLAAERADGMAVGDFGLSVNDDGMIVGAPTVGGSLTITVTATDSGGAMFEQAFTLETNRVPTLANAIGDVAETVGEAIEPIDLSNLFADSDGMVTDIEIVSGLDGTGLNFDETTHVISGSFTGTTDATVLVRATDDDGASGEHAFVIMANAAPTVVTAEADDEVNLTFETDMNLPIDLNDWFDDADEDTLTYTATVGDTALASAGIGLMVSGNQITGRFTETGDVEVKVTARDANGGSVTHTFTIKGVVPDLEGTTGNDDDLTDNAPNWDRTIRGLAGDDTITGGAGNDTIDGGENEDTAVYAGAFDDFTITGAFSNSTATITVLDDEAGNHGDEGRDTLENVERIQFGTASFNIVTGDGDSNTALDGGTGDDLIFGFGGDDTIDGGAGDDTIDGGAGDMDTATYDGAFADFNITGSLSGSSATITVEDAEASVDGDEGIDTLTNIKMLQFGTNSFNIVTGNDARTTINGGTGADLIFGFGGDDTLQGHGGDDVFWGGPGDDRIFEAAGEDTVIYDGNYKDFTFVQTNITTIWEFIIEDTIGVGDDDEGRDTVYVTEKIRFNNIDFDIVPGTGGVDNIQGESGNEMILGFDGGTGTGASTNERINGGLGHDIILGGDDVDFIRGDGIYSPSGNDKNDSDVIYGFGGNDTLHGDNGNDDIYGGLGDDTIYAGDGDDEIDGGADNDTINGDKHNDIITGGGGNDTIDGGENEDTAVYAGNRDDYSIWKDGNNFIVYDKKGDSEESEGRDTLSNIEKIKFGDADAVDLNDALASDTPVQATRAPRKDEIVAFSVEDDITTPPDVPTAVQSASTSVCDDCGVEIDPMPSWTADDPCGCLV